MGVNGATWSPVLSKVIPPSGYRSSDQGYNLTWPGTRHHSV